MRRTAPVFTVSGGCPIRDPVVRAILNMRSWPFAINVLLSSLLVSLNAKAAGSLLSSNAGEAVVRVFAAKGVVEELKPDDSKVVLKHEAISNYMDAMTMPFKVKEATELAGLQTGDKVSFQLHVTETESWVDQIKKMESERRAPTRRVPLEFMLQLGRQTR
jgi:Cu/Ag efflux protein CusF